MAAYPSSSPTNMASFPSSSPTGGLYPSKTLDEMMIGAETVSIVLRSCIGIICFRRLNEYHQRGLLRFGEIKAAFHAAMFLTLFFSLPYFIYCGPCAHYDVYELPFSSP